MRRHDLWSVFACAGAALILAACGDEAASPSASVPISAAPNTAHPDIWPVLALPQADPAVEARVEALLARMTLEEKIGQIIQAELQSVTPEDVRQYRLGSVLNGGGSTPGNNRYATPDDWLEMADAFWEASTDTSDGGVGIPIIWGTDAVHGHNVVYGATIFPHNIGLGAANDPDLMHRIGAATAREVRVTGHDWNFGPTVAVPRDGRWGRTYEGYSEDPALVARLAAPYVEGLQGAPGDDTFLDDHRIVATAKHFIGDGGTAGGVDQGDVRTDEATLRDIHLPGYVTALEAGAQTVMASYSSWHGRKMHGFDELLTDVLKTRMGFDGFVVGDWNGHSQIPGCRADNCPQAFNAGIDMFMVPQDWRALYENTLAQARDGTISEARLDDAVRRILRVKARAGLLDAPRPSQRPLAGDDSVLGDPAHRAIAREAVRKSLVLLKNEGGVLPLRPGARVMVAGPGADNIPMQVGGWSLTWQGTGLANDDFPGGTSIWEGIYEAAAAHGGEAWFSEAGDYHVPPDIAIVVYGETPYAEGVGDRDTVAYSPGEDADLELLRRLRADGVPVVSVFLSGRPLWTNPHINASDAFVAAWLPGTEGGGVADVLYGDADFTGRLAFSWPRNAAQAVLNAGDPGYDPLFLLGYGLGINDDGSLPELSEDPGIDLASLNSRSVFFANAAPLRPWRLTLTPPGGGALGDNGAVRWTGDSETAVSLSAFQPIDMGFATNAVMALTAELRVTEALGGGAVTLGLGGPDGDAHFDVTDRVVPAGAGDTVTLRVPLLCFADAGVAMEAVNQPFALTTAAPFAVQILDVRLTEREAGDACPD